MICSLPVKKENLKFVLQLPYLSRLIAPVCSRVASFYDSCPRKISFFPPLILTLLLLYANLLSRRGILPAGETTNHSNFTRNMVAIRLNRQGSKDRPYYKIVVVDSRARRDGDFIDQVGTYNPMAEGVNYTIDLEKVDKWIGNGAQPSETVASMIKKARAAKA